MKRLLLIAVTTWSLGCWLTASDDGKHFTFPDESEGDHLDDDGAWRGTRTYKGSKSAWIDVVTPEDLMPCDKISYHINWKEVQVLSKGVPGTSVNSFALTMSGHCKNPVTQVELVAHEE